jgi:hypothetical protein
VKSLKFKKKTFLAWTKQEKQGQHYVKQCPNSSVFFGQNFAKCQPEKYDFDLCKRIFHEKNDPIFPDFYDNFQ